MALKVRNGMVFDESNTCVAVIADLPPDHAEEIERIIEFGSEAAPALVKLMDEINSGKFKPRAIVKEIELIHNKYK